MKPKSGVVKILWSIVLFLVLIGVVVVLRRMLNILSPSPAPSRFPEAAGMDKGFTSHPLLTMVHIVPGLLFVVLGPFQFVRSLRNRRPKLHRWSGRVFLVA